LEKNAFVDPSGGSSDSMTLAIAHRDEWSDRAALDAVREIKPKFSPDAVVEEFSALLKSYGVTQVYGDRYGGEWPRERFRYHGIAYRPADKTKSEIYLALLPMLNSRTAELLDVRRLEDQLVGLERRTSRGGRDSIDHAPNGHDDVANAAAGALVLAAGAESQKIHWSAVSGATSYSTSTGKRYVQHPSLEPVQSTFGNICYDGTNKSWQSMTRNRHIPNNVGSATLRPAALWATSCATARCGRGSRLVLTRHLAPPRSRCTSGRRRSGCGRPVMFALAKAG
jgi:hypothetical protein